MYAAPMEEPHQDPFSLGHVHGGNEIAVSSYKNGFLDLALGCQLNEVYAQHDVDSLLFKY